MINLPVLNKDIKPLISITVIHKQEETKPKEVLYTFKLGDNLTALSKTPTAEAQGASVDRLYDKNPNITDPDHINVGETIVIPLKDEKLTDRPLPVTIEPQLTRVAGNPASSGVSVNRGGSYRNDMYAGYCTWYAKERRPDLPTGLGNAETWTIRARAMGIPTGTIPRAAAVGQLGNHVVIVESVNPNGTFNLSEMNYVAFNTVSTRQSVSPAGWSFIY